MFHGRRQLGQRFLDGVDLVIDFATLGEYGLEPLHADGFSRERAGRRSRPNRRPGWEALVTTRRGACGQGTAGAFRFPGAESRRPVDFRAAVDRFAA
jgi:hypothetical protein